jgi:hypothetical protein
MRQIFILNSPYARRKAQEALHAAGDDWVVQVSPPKRSTAQNALMWALLGDVASQVVWHGQKLTPENWKDILTASLKRQEVVPGIGGGFVVLGTSTRRMAKLEMNELIELIYAFGAQHGVVFSEYVPELEAV